jgi:PAS domain S-box-containing protein
MVNRKQNNLKSKNSKLENTSISINSICNEISSNIFEMFSNGIIIEDSNGIILDVNNNFCDLMLYNREELVGKKIHILTHPDVRKQVDKNIERLLKGEYLKHREKSIRKDGSICYVKLKEKSVTFPNGQKGIVCFIEDISDQLETKEALKESEERYSKLLDLSPEAIAIHQNGKFIYVNNSAVILIKAKSKEELIGKSVLSIVHPDYRELAITRIQNMIKYGKDVPMVEEKFVCLDGTFIDVEIKAMPIVYKGKPAIQVVARDITKYKISELSIKKKNQELENLLETARHLTQSIDVKDVLNKVATGAMEILNASSFGVYLLEKDGETLNPVVAIDPEYEEELLATKIKVHNSLTGKSVLAKKGLIFNDISNEQSAYQIPGTPEEIDERIIAVPFLVEDKVLGALIVSRMGTLFTEEELALTETYATYASAALKNAQLFNSLQTEVDERKQAQKKTYELNLQYESFIQNSLVGIWKLGFADKIPINLPVNKLAENIFYNGIFIDCNDAFAKMYNYSSKEKIIGTKNSEQNIDHENSIYSLEKFVKNNFKTEIIDSQETDKDGTIKHFRKSYFGVIDKGFLIWVWGIQIEITEQKRLEAQLLQSQKMEAVGTLAGGISHDFNNFLTVINGYAQISLKRMDENDPLFRYINTILKAGKKAEDLTRQLLAFSRKQIFQAKVIDLNSLIISLEHMLRRFISEDIEMEMILSKENPAIKADPGQIEQIFMNLIVNARDAVNHNKQRIKKKKITIETAITNLDENYVKNHPGSKVGKYAYISVTDTGIGIEDEIKEKIFEPFFTTKEKSQGTGLGLATVYGIVKQNNGSIYVYSEKEYGTTFKIYWPIADEIRIIDEDTKFADFELNGNEAILLVEDDEEVRGFASTALQNLGYSIFEAENGKQALKFVNDSNKKAKLNIDLLVTDMVMPEMNGKELANELKKIYPGTKIIFTSGYTDNHIVQSGNLDKGINFIQKPFSEKTLAHKIRTVLDKQ